MKQGEKIDNLTGGAYNEQYLQIRPQCGVERKNI